MYYRFQNKNTFHEIPEKRYRTKRNTKCLHLYNRDGCLSKVKYTFLSKRLICEQRFNNELFCQ